ncbi:MAG TPA: hypothetical protein VFZ46_02285 [Nitrososphaeraceae archaeon]
MKQTYFLITLITALTIGVLSINSGITFAQEKNETSEIDDSPLITTSQIDESMETNNTLSQTVNDTS